MNDHFLLIFFIQVSRVDTHKISYIETSYLLILFSKYCRSCELQNNGCKKVKITISYDVYLKGTKIQNITSKL